MLRAFLLSLTLATTAVFLACSEGAEDPISSGDQITAAGKGNCPFIAEIADVFSPGGLRNAVTQQCNNVERVYDGGNGDTADAIAKVFSLVNQILGHHQNGQTTGDDEAVATLLNALLEFVGLEGIFPDVVDENTGGGTCDNDGCTIVNQSGLAGIRVPPQTDLGLCYISFSLLEFDPDRFSGFDAYPFQFDFDITCASDANGGLDLAEEEPIYDPPAIVGLCFADPPLGPSLEDVPEENRQLAHLPDGEEEPVLLPVEVADFLSDDDCEDASVVEEEVSLPFRTLAKLEPISEFFVSPLFASPGRLGGAIAAHSPVGGVDNREQEPETTPTTTTLTLNGQTMNLTIFHGETATATADVDPAPSNGLEPFVDFFWPTFSGNTSPTATRFLDDGEANLDFLCDTEGTLTPGEGVQEVGSGSLFVRAEFPGAGQFESSVSNEPILSCQAIIG